MSTFSNNLDLFVNIGTVGLINTNINQHINVKPNGNNVPNLPEKPKESIMLRE